MLSGTSQMAFYFFKTKMIQQFATDICQQKGLQEVQIKSAGPHVTLWARSCPYQHTEGHKFPMYILEMLNTCRTSWNSSSRPFTGCMLVKNVQYNVRSEDYLSKVYPLLIICAAELKIMEPLSSMYTLNICSLPATAGHLTVAEHVNWLWMMCLCRISYDI